MNTCGLTALGISTVPQFNGFENKKDRFVSIYGNLAYTYNNRYTISGSARKDGGNVLRS